MEVLLEILLWLILEPMMYAYVDFIKGVMPQKTFKKRQTNLLIILCMSMFIVALFLIIIGIFWSSDKPPFNTYGRIMSIVGASIILIHIILSIIAHFLKEDVADKIDEKDLETVETDNIEPVVIDKEYREPAPIVYQMSNEEE